MNQTAATTGLRRRNAWLAAILSYFVAPVGYAYVQQLGLGIALVLAGPALMFIAGRLGIVHHPYGYPALAAALLLLAVAIVVQAFRLARALPEGATRRWYNKWYHCLWIGGVTIACLQYAAGHRASIFGFEPFRIPSMAMQPTLEPGDFITVDARASAMSRIARGDIVVFRPQAHPRETWIKRVIGLPGETVLVKGNSVEINGSPLSEQWTTVREPVMPISIPFERVVLGSDEYFLMGDNRPNSEDSRFTGPVKRAALCGKARVIWLHFSPATHSIDTSRIGALASAETN